MDDLSNGDIEDPLRGRDECSNPSWISIVDNVRSRFQELESELRHLASEQESVLHVKISFTNEAEGQDRCKDLTESIGSHFTYCYKWVSMLDKNGVGSNQDKTVRKNVQMALATQLQSLSTGFRRKQREYMSKLKRHDQFANKGDDPFGFIPTFEEDEAMDEYTLQQMEDINTQVDGMDAMVDERQREIHEIAKSIADLAQIFRELSTLVIDSGTILDRIDYNMEQVQVNVEYAEQDLEKAAGYQSAGKGCSAWCIIFLVFACCVMALVLGLKKGLAD